MKKVFALGIVFVALLVCVGAVSAYSTLTLVAKSGDPLEWTFFSTSIGTLFYNDDGSWLGFHAGDHEGELMTDTKYSLISFKEPDGAGSKVIGTGSTQWYGELDISGSSTAMDLVLNTYTHGEYAGQTGARIMLVPSSDLTATEGITSFNAWNPNLYLFETGLINPGSGTPQVTGVYPATGVNTGPVTVRILNPEGAQFVEGITVKLTKSGEPAIPATDVVYVEWDRNLNIYCTFPLSGAATGDWNIVVTIPDGQTVMLANGFTVTAPSNVPEFPSVALPAAFIVGLIGAVLCIQRTKE